MSEGCLFSQVATEMPRHCDDFAWRGSAEGGAWASPHIDKQGGSAFLEAGTV